MSVRQNDILNMFRRPNALQFLNQFFSIIMTHLPLQRPRGLVFLLLNIVCCFDVIYVFMRHFYCFISADISALLVGFRAC